MPDGKTKPSSRPARIFLVDDHPIVRRGLAELITPEQDLEVCGEAGSVTDALQQIRTVEPDLVVVDITLEEGNGIELIKEIRARHSNIKMLVISMHEDSLYAERALRAGALGYLNKKEVAENTIEAIRRVLAGHVYLSGGMADHLLHRVVNGQAAATSPLEALSDRELEVFQMIGRGMTISQIAEQLHRSIKTIESHRDHIKAKLGIATSSELARHAMLWAMENR